MTRYQTGGWVKLREAHYGTAQGPSAEHGHGRPWEVPAGAICEVFGIDATAGWLTLHFDLDESGPREPYRVEVIVEPKDIEPTQKPAYQGWDGVTPDPRGSSEGTPRPSASAERFGRRVSARPAFRPAL